MCGGLLIPKAANKVGAGARTYSRIPDDHENVPIPEAVPFKLFASIGVDLVSCRGNYGGAMIQTGSAATPTIVTTTVVHGSPAPRRNAEQIVTLQAPGTFYSGAAFLQWTSPEGDEYHITLSFPASVNPRPTIGDLTVVSDIPRCRHHQETNGFRIGFIGRWSGRDVGLITVIENDLTAAVITLSPVRFESTVGLYLGNSPVGIFGATIQGSTSRRCPSSFSHSIPISNSDHSLTGQLTMEGG